jgi:hypothetical protein
MLIDVILPFILNALSPMLVTVYTPQSVVTEAGIIILPLAVGLSPIDNVVGELKT